jgi:hypothetical protein
VLGKATPPTIARFGLLLGPLIFLAMVGYVVSARVAYPFQLEWMEGGSLQHLLRLQAGLPIYVPPSLEFTAYQYPPFYYYLALLVAKLPGIGGFLALRLTSLLASLGCTACIVLIIRRHTASLYWGLVGAGLFVATFRQGGAWFDIARVDMLFLFLLLAAQAALLLCRPGEIWAGVLLGLAFYTKQTGLMVGVPLIAAVMWRRGLRAGLLAALPFLVVAAGTFALEEWRSGGWYSYYVVGLPKHHGLARPFFEQLAFRSAKLFEPLPIAAAAGLAYAVLARREAWKQDAAVTGIFLLALVGLGVAARLTHACYDNVNIPAYAALSILLGLAGCGLDQRITSDLGKVGISVACAAQFVLLTFGVRAQIPTQADRQAGQSLVQQIREAPGDVLIPAHNYLAQAAGKAMFAHEIALQEIQGAFTDQGFVADPRLEETLRRDLANRRFGAVLLDSDHPIWRPVLEAYQSTPILYPHTADFLPVTGMRTRPESCWRPPD